MNGRKERRLGIALIIVALLLAAYTGYTYFYPNDSRKHKVQESKKEVINKSEKEAESETVPFEIENVTEEQMEALNMDIQELKEMIYEWTQKNGEYKSAIGVEFYDDEEVNITDEKYSFMMKTLVGEGHLPEESRILVIDYYTDLNKYVIHP